MAIERENDSSLLPTEIGKMVVVEPSDTNCRLLSFPHKDHMVENYEDLSMDFDPMLFSSLERYLPKNLLDASRERKYEYMWGILRRYLTAGEHKRVQKHIEYQQHILSSYQPLYRELYTMQSSMFFLESFLDVCNPREKEREICIRRITSEIAPGIFTFDMLHPCVCEMLLREVENMEKWHHEKRFMMLLPSTINKSGIVVDDFGMQGTLDKLLQDFIGHISKVFFPDIYSLDSHHGYVVQYGIGRDVEAGLHVDDSDVTLNICLGKEFTGGGLFFRGMRCAKHLNTEALPEEDFDYTFTPGQAIIHRGCHRHGARAITSGHRINLVMWCKSSVFRELNKHTKDFSGSCGKCQREKKERIDKSVVARTMALIAHER